MQGMVPLCGFGGVPYSAVRKAAPRNLLDNSDFRNPVNQRGKTTDNATDWAYDIDRWIFGNVTYKLATNGITLTPYGSGEEHLMAQYLEKQDFLIGKKITFAVGLSNGNVCIATGTVPQKSDWAHIAQAELNGVNLEVMWSGGDNYLMPRILVSQETTVAWAALYEGEYTAETLPEYHPKGCGAELAECQRYYQNLSTIDNAFDVVLNGFVSNTSTALAVSLPGMSKMRITPTVVFSGGIVVRGNNGYSSDATYGTPYMSPNVVPRLNTLVFYKSDNSAWAGIDNNTNISISLKLSSILSLSADL